MTDTALLRSKIAESGMTITAVAKKSGITRYTLYNKLNGKSEFSASEIVTLTNVLSLSKNERDEIFLM